MADLFGGHLFGVEERGQGLVYAVPRAVGTGDFEGVADAAFHGHGAGVDAGAEIDGYLDVAEFAGGCHAVDRDVGRTECRPQVVGVLAQPGCGFVGGVEEAPGGTAVAGAGRCDRPGE